jgi:FlaA1/EpsC-like NDP-sugar epimerase
VSSTPLTEALDPLIEARPLAQPEAREWHLDARAWTWIVFALDATMFLAGSLAAQYGAKHAGVTPLSPGWMLVFAGVLFPLLAARGLYRRRLQSQILDDARVVLFALTLSATLVLSLQVLVEGSGDGALLAREWAFVAVYLLGGRTALQWSLGNAFRAGRLVRPTLMSVGAGSAPSLPNG